MKTFSTRRAMDAVWHRSTGSRAAPHFFAFTLVLLLGSLGRAATAQAAVVERQLDVRMTLSGTQSWKNPPQYTEATTAQDYDFSVRLRSDGFLYSDNLLSTDLQERLAIKEQYYARQGLLQLKAQNAGKLPRSPAEVDKLAQQTEKAAAACHDEFECTMQAHERYAALESLKNNSVAALEEFLASPGTGDEPRYQYFYGYAGCPVRIHVRYEVHIKGMRAFDRKRQKNLPYALDRSADTSGSDEDRKTLCEKYVAVVDVKSGALFVENLFIPSPPGNSVQTIDGKAAQQNITLPPPPALLDWSSAKLRQSTLSGNEKVTLNLNLPLDGDSTVLGDFVGPLNVAMTWSFKPVTATPSR